MSLIRNSQRYSVLARHSSSSAAAYIKSRQQQRKPHILCAHCRRAHRTHSSSSSSSAPSASAPVCRMHFRPIEFFYMHFIDWILKMHNMWLEYGGRDGSFDWALHWILGSGTEKRKTNNLKPYAFSSSICQRVPFFSILVYLYSCFCCVANGRIECVLYNRKRTPFSFSAPFDILLHLWRKFCSAAAIDIFI